MTKKKTSKRTARVARQKSRPAGKVEAPLLELVRAGRDRSQRLARELMQAQEQERRRLARELHDEIGQALTAVKLNLEALRSALNTPLVEQLGESMGLVEGALAQVRSLSLDLRPPMLDDLGLAPALRWYLDRQAQRGKLTMEFSARPEFLRAPAALETICFRVAQEALTNVLRHAQATRVKVQLTLEEDALDLTVADDGKGFDVLEARRQAQQGASLGLLGMQERVVLAGGRLDLISAPGVGTMVHVCLPVSERPVVERRSRGRKSR